VIEHEGAPAAVAPALVPVYVTYSKCQTRTRAAQEPLPQPRRGGFK
jgi:hypothetical protein